MEQGPIACGNQLPPLSTDLPWLAARTLDGIGDKTFYTINDKLGYYKSHIPKLLGSCIRGYFYGWMILSNNNMWSLWNPVISKIIYLPPLTLSDTELIEQCCLSAPPNDPVSVLLLTITGKSTFVFCQPGVKLDSLRWTKMSYSRQLKRILGQYGGFLQWPTSYNSKVYALCSEGKFVVQVDITMKDEEVMMKILLLGRRPSPSNDYFPISIPLLKGSSTGLFYITVAFNGVTKKTFGNVCLFKWVVTSMSWEKLVDIKDAVFFVDLARNYIVYCNHAVASELGGCIHIRDEMGNMMYSYDVEGKTISVSSMGYPTIHVSSWECRLEGFELTDARSATDDEVELNESRLLNLPLHLLEGIMDYCIGVEYSHFRATCKICHSAAPLIQWSNKQTSRRLHKYSLASPWLMVVDKTHKVINFTDPMFGDKYFMKRSQVIIDCDKIRCSTFGWLLLQRNSSIFFFNPLTGDIRELPNLIHLNSLCFSAPPTSSDCMVVGFTNIDNGARVYIHSVTKKRTMSLDFYGLIPNRFSFPTICGEDIYVMCNKGEVYVFKNVFKLQGYYLDKIPSARSYGGEYFIVRINQHILQVIVGEFGEYVEVFILNRDYRKGWEKIEHLGKYMIFIGGSTCLCIEAKESGMENKIYFPRLHSKNGKIVFYSLETHRYHMFSGKKIAVGGLGREHVYPHAWIEPTWS